MNNTCQNNFYIYIMLGFCPFLKVKLFFFWYLSSILQFLEIWHIVLPELCNFWPFLSFFALIYRMALTATMIPDRKIKAHPRRSRERPGEKKNTRNRGSTVLSGGNSHIITAYNINSKIKITRYIIKKTKTNKNTNKKTNKN